MSNQHIKYPTRSEEHFWAKVNKAGPPWDGNSCWIWEGTREADGYGRFKPGPRPVMAHRFAYQLLSGSIPEGLQLDHLCRNRGCVNPMHLEAVLPVVNIRRGMTGKVNNRNSRKTHCPQGHPYDLLNTYHWPNAPSQSRLCRECARQRERLRRLHR